jgi:hypothetical protein
MQVVSPTQMEETWRSVAASSPEEIRKMQKASGTKQEELTAFVLAFLSGLSSEALGLALWVHLVVMQAFLRSGSRFKRVKPNKIERAWRENQTLCAELWSSAEDDPYGELAHREASEPAVVQYIIDAMTEVSPDDPIAISEEERRKAVQVLKTVSDCLHDAYRVR